MTGDYPHPLVEKTGVRSNFRTDQMKSVSPNTIAGVWGRYRLCPMARVELGAASNADDTNYKRSSPTSQARVGHHHAEKKPMSGGPDVLSCGERRRCAVRSRGYWE